jgi:hypothetical protein
MNDIHNVADRVEGNPAQHAEIAQLSIDMRDIIWA